MKIVYIVLGFIALGLGTLGIALPILPTVPFYLLASWCFAKGSDRFSNWFKGTKLYKKHLESFEKNKEMTMKTKLKILIPVSIMLLIVFFRYDVLPMRITIAALIAFKYYYFLVKIKTKPETI